MRVLGEMPLWFVGGLDLHRKQVTVEVLDTDTGQLLRGRVAPANREVFRGWLAQFTGREADLAVEGGVPGGGSSWRSARPPGFGCIWPSRPTWLGSRAVVTTPRPIRPTRSICGKWCRRARCRSRG